MAEKRRQIERVWCDWKQPALLTAARWLVDQYRAGELLDLKQAVVTLPGARAGRRLLEILVELAEEQQLILVPPRIVTMGKLPELLYEVKKPFAGNLAQQLAWVRALRTTPAASVAKVVRKPPADDDLPAWLSLGQLLSQLHRELASDQLDFQKVVERAGKLAGFDEQPRWQALAEIQDRYLRYLDSLDLWDMQTARLFAVEHREFETDCDIVLVGMVDMDRTQRAMLAQVADRVTALVLSDDAHAKSFDEFGCLVPSAWQDEPCPLSDDQFEIVDGPADQADATLRAIAGFDGRYGSEEIVIGVPDKRVMPQLEQRLHEAELPNRFVVGAPISRSGPGRLLKAVADFLHEPRYTAMACLVRHPDVLKWLAANGCDGDCLTPLDRYHVEHLPSRTGDRWLGNGAAKAVRAIHQKLEQLVKPLGGKPRRLDQWGSEIAGLLLSVYGAAELDKENEADRGLLAACRQIRDGLQEHQQLHASLAPTVSAAQAIRLLLAEMDSVAAPPSNAGPAIELLGWLELPLDDAPALVITGFNEGFVPSAHNGDMFLPNGLRRQLELEDNDRRYARDIYYLRLLAVSRRDLKVIAGRRSADNEPLVPSRLLLACCDDELPKRTRRCFSNASSQPTVQVAGRPKPGTQAHQFAIPRPAPLKQPVERLKVTEFRDYLACPYRYYLRHQLKLDEMTDDVCELDAAQFGSLIHDVLKQFSLGEFRDSADDREIEEQLSVSLSQIALRSYGEFPLATVSLQIEQARLRLRGFARWQAKHRKDGWRIRFAEEEVKGDSAPLLVDGRPMYLRGRIDRIDFNEQTGHWLVLDYKTGDSSDEPDKVHRAGDQWVDLQLPLYRHLARALDVGEPLKLGFLRLPKTVAGADCCYAEWSEDELAAADEVAAEVIRSIRLQRFWPPSQNLLSFDAFSIICQADQFSLRGAGAGDDEEDA